MKKLKKVGWIKYSGSVDIGKHLLSTSGFTDIRTTMIKTFIENKIEVHIFSAISMKTKKYMQTLNFSKEMKGNEKFIYIHNKKLKIDVDLDLLIVENGASNTSFSTVINGKDISTIAVTNSLISSYKGLVLFLESDLDLPFAFFPDFYSKGFVNDYLHYGNFYSLLKDKRWVVLTSSKKPEYLTTINDSYRFKYSELYKNGLINFENFEYHFYSIFWKDNLFFNMKAVDGLVYIGAERSRMEKIKKYYIENKVPSYIYGKWSDKTKQKFTNVNWMGIAPDGQVYETYNKYMASVIIGNKNYEKAGMVSKRLYEASIGRCVPFFDEDLAYTTSIKDVFPKYLIKELVVRNAKELEDKFLNIKKDINLRFDLVYRVIDSVLNFNEDTSHNELVRIYNKYSEKGKTKFENKDFKIKKVFNDIIEERNSRNEFHSFLFSHFLKKYYENNSDDYDIFKNENKIKIINSNEGITCYKCGEKMEAGKSKQSSRMKCDKCKKENNNTTYLKRLHLNFKNIKRGFTIEKRKET